ncbi:hypothetical protein M501DRAFT_1055576 [Patellaria atrata CBS 101060]|uniref:CRIB domain-containing protein n=1 Tax=Patellaria atrata CBS 101060 TaxID=1346257 RepID=A0A9P4SEP4_9PEZI|nr:hypothetical protein M501DRAFT_1055576 [Patellaria atrata CBS 101060]
MFLFKGSPSPRSRQSSIDTPPLDDSISESSSAKQPSETTSIEVADLPARGERLPHGKRGSVFTLRSRSNTTASTNSSFLSFSSTMTPPEMFSRRSSQDLKVINDVHSVFDVKSGKSKGFFLKGRSKRRESGRLNYSPSMDFASARDSHKTHDSFTMLAQIPDVPFVEPDCKWAVSSSYHRVNHVEVQHRKSYISAPFDFQHLTHTQKDQLPALFESNDNQLVNEYWTVRASQVPSRELHGIRAENIRPGPLQSPPKLRSKLSKDLRFASHPSQDPSIAIRRNRSIESFSQPLSRARSPTVTSIPVTPPPRMSSRMAVSRIEDVSPKSSTSSAHVIAAIIPGNIDRSVVCPWESIDSLDDITPSSEQRTNVIQSSSQILHAVTTPDDTAVPALSPEFTPDLDHIPEEPDGYFPSWKEAPLIDRSASEARLRRSAILAVPARSASRPSPYFPKVVTPTNLGTRPTSRPASCMSDTLGLGSPFGSPPLASPDIDSARDSKCWSPREDLDPCWEDVIDFACENAWDAESELDKGRQTETEEALVRNEQQLAPWSTSAGELQQNNTECGYRPEILKHTGMKPRNVPAALRPSLLVPSHLAVPEMDLPSAHSVSTASDSAVTPVDGFPLGPSDRMKHYSNGVFAEGLVSTPSLLVPNDFRYQMMREEMYNELSDYESSDRHYPLVDSIPGSKRSSTTRLSKTSSNDSSVRSGPNSLVLSIRQSASSSGSLPELVYSRRNVHGSTVVEQLVEQVASISPRLPSNDSSKDGFMLSNDSSQIPTQEYDDTDTSGTPTPPASAQNVPQSAVIHHERSASESAAKLLFDAPKSAPLPEEPPALPSRHRSQSLSAKRASKATYTLSLFPTPPKPRKIVN